MILTAHEIVAARARGELVIEPFNSACLNPNSYDVALGARLLTFPPDAILDPVDPAAVRAAAETLEIGGSGLVLTPGRLYLGHTIEVAGGTGYVPTISARSSVARLGLFIHLSASLGDQGYVGQWTLQLCAVQPVRVRAGMRIAQLMWWCTQGEPRLYEGKYQGATGPVTCRGV